MTICSRCRFPALLTLLGVLLSGTLGFSGPTGDEPHSSAGSQVGPLRPFTTVEGGVSLAIPAGWHVKEFPQKNLYRCTVSPEPPVEGQDPVKQEGLVIERTSNFTRALGWKKAEPKVQAIGYAIYVGTRYLVATGRSPVVSFTKPNPTPEEIAQAIARSRSNAPDAGKARPAVVLIPIVPSKVLSGMEAFEYDVLANYDGSECVYYHLLMGVLGKQWLAFRFSSTDCTSRDTLREMFLEMVTSLEIQKAWPK